MSTHSQATTKLSASPPLTSLGVAKPKKLSSSGSAGLMLQRKCACGSPGVSLAGDCAECKTKKLPQMKLTVGASSDPLELEADRVAEQVLATPSGPFVTGTRPRIQRFSGHPTVERALAPASVDRVLFGSGRPLDPALQQDMEQRFGHDFSRVRVHSGDNAAQSAQELNALAYTVGHNIVFGRDSFAPNTNEGRRLLAHELTHVAQQSGVDKNSVGQVHEERGLGGVSSTTRHIQRDGNKKTDPVVKLEQNGDKWELTIMGFTEAKAVEGFIWPSGTPRGVRIRPLVVVQKPAQVGLFEITGLTLKALDTMASPFPSWFMVSGISWTVDDLKKLLNACDGGIGIWEKAKKANKGKDPKITPGQGSSTDLLTGEITLNQNVDKCQSVQALVHELSNLYSTASLRNIEAAAAAGDLSRDEFIKGLEKIEYEVGVKNVLVAFDACKDKWLCQTSIMEFARKAKDFEDYFKNLIIPAHKEGYGKEWDKRFKPAYQKKHP